VAAGRLSLDFIALGLMRGDVEQIVESGAYALFFPMAWGTCLAWMSMIWRLSEKIKWDTRTTSVEMKHLASTAFVWRSRWNPGLS
jgi:hypothetical protein